MSRKKRLSSRNYFRSRTIKKSLQGSAQWMTGILLLPCLWAALKIAGLMIPAVLAEGIWSWWLYAAGAVVSLGVGRLVRKPTWFYVFGHELTHALSGLLSGAKIHSLRAGARGGEVRLSRSNAFVALSPYILPFYVMVVFVLYAAFMHWLSHPLVTYVFQFLLGAALMFHVTSTLSAVHRRQPDLKILGFFLSAVCIALGNIVILGLMMVSLFHTTPTVKQYGTHLWTETVNTWKSGLQTLPRPIPNEPQ